MTGMTIATTNWREYRAEGTCERCGADLFMRLNAHAENEPTADVLAARYVSHIMVLCPNCDWRITPQSFDPDFTPDVPEVVYFSEAWLGA